MMDVDSDEDIEDKAGLFFACAVTCIDCPFVHVCVYVEQLLCTCVCMLTILLLTMWLCAATVGTDSFVVGGDDDASQGA